MNDINTYLCNKKYPVIDIVKQDMTGVSSKLQKAEITPGEEFYVCIVDAFMISVGAEQRKVQVQAEIIKSDAVVIECLLDRVSPGVLVWARNIRATSGGDFSHRDDYITVTINHPEIPCFWIETNMYGVRDLTFNPLFIRQVSSIDNGMIPESGSKQDAYPGHAGKVERITNTQTQFVPGELLQLAWDFIIDGQAHNSVVAGSYFHTPVFTGGVVASKPNPEGHVNTSYTVNVQGHDVVCTPTDFANYQIGDWVYVIKQSENEAYHCDRKRTYESDETYAEESVTSEYSSGDYADMENEIVVLTNQERVNHGLSPFSKHSALFRSAKKHSMDMVENNFYSHTGSDGSSAHERVLEAGYPTPCMSAENIAAGQGSAREVVNGWMNSPGHRANILHEDLEEIGVSVSRYPEEPTDSKYSNMLAFVQNFGSHFEPEEETPEEETVETDFRVLPMRVNSIGNTNGDFETLEFNMLSVGAFEEFFEASIHEAVITELWPENLAPEDKASIEVFGLGEEMNQSFVYEWVPIHFHCEYSNTTSGGIAAFEVGDEVLVLNPHGDCVPDSNFHDLRIIGHKDRLVKCQSRNALIVSERRFRNFWHNNYGLIYDEDGETVIGCDEPEEAGNAIVWDIDNGNLALVVGIDGEEEIQPINYFKLAYLMSLPVNGATEIGVDFDERRVRRTDAEYFNEENGFWDETTEQWVMATFYLQKGELKHSEMDAGRRAIYYYLYYYNFHDLNIEKFIYKEDPQLGNQPLSFYNRYVSGTTENDVDIQDWELFTDYRMYEITICKKVIDIPTEDLEDMANIKGKPINQADPNHEDYYPNLGIGYTVHPYVQCSGDSVEEQRGTYVFLHMSGKYDSAFSPHSYFSTNDATTFGYAIKWQSFMPGSEEQVLIQVAPPYNDSDVYFSISGEGEPKYNHRANFDCGVYEGEYLAVAFEYIDIPFYVKNKYSGDVIENLSEKLFKVYFQKKPLEPEEDYKLVNFEEIPNMEGLKQFVANNLEFFYKEEDMAYNRQITSESEMSISRYNYSAGHSGDGGTAMKLPVISYHRLTFG